LSHATRADHAPQPSVRRVAFDAARHCLTGCAIGEVLGMVIGSAIGLSNAATLALGALTVVLAACAADASTTSTRS